MAKRKTYDEAFRTKALTMMAEVGPEATAKAMKVHPSQLYQWRKKATTPTKGSTGERVKDALVFLKHAQKSVLDRIRKGTLKEPDQGHLYAMQALKLLEE